MNIVNGNISYGKHVINFRILYVDRKTLEIAVHPDQNVVIRAPLDTTFNTIEKIVVKRARWIQQQMDYFQQFEPRTPERRYIGGETHLYLGRHYRLKIQSHHQNLVKLVNGYLHIQVHGGISPEKVKSLLEQWYAKRANVKFMEAYGKCWPFFREILLKQPKIQIRRMKTRWGSMSKRGILTVNTDLIRAPKECIDYVIIHELCHLQYPNHGPDFYKLIESVMPDWERRKHKLEVTLV